MREILFRGKANSEIRDGEWVYGSLLAESENTFPIIARSYDNDEDWLGIDLWDTVEPQTVGQFTGMCDKNDRKIFEGDIMTFEAFGFKYIGIVQIIDGNATILCDNQISPKGSPFLDDATKRYNAIIIGNIHDNPELLKGGEG